MQHSHHGISDMSDEMIRTVGAEYIFWPVAILQKDMYAMKAGWVYWEIWNGKHKIHVMGIPQNQSIVEKMPDGTVFVADDDIFVATFENGVLDVARYENMADYLMDKVAD